MSETYAEPLNPVWVENAIRECATRISKGVRVVTGAEREYLAADRVYDRAYAQAFLEYEGPQTEKRYAAEVATADEREARDIAYLAFKHAQRTADAIGDELRSLQSINKSMVSVYGATTGVGS
jgi:hypothetical protein